MEGNGMEIRGAGRVDKGDSRGKEWAWKAGSWYGRGRGSGREVWSKQKGNGDLIPLSFFS